MEHEKGPVAPADRAGLTRRSLVGPDRAKWTVSTVEFTIGKLELFRPDSLVLTDAGLARLEAFSHDVIGACNEWSRYLDNQDAAGSSGRPVLPDPVTHGDASALPTAPVANVTRPATGSRKPPFPAPAKKGGGCYVATAVYGSYDSPEVKVLRRYRDEVMVKSGPARAFIRTYYLVSPPMARCLRDAGTADRLVMQILDRLVKTVGSRAVGDRSRWPE